MHTAAWPEPGSSFLGRAVVASALGAGFAALDLALVGAGVTAPQATTAFGVAALVALAVGASFVLGRSLPAARDSSGALETAALAHDLRAPLASGRTLLQLLESGALGNLTAEVMDTVSRASTAVARAQAVLDGALLTRNEASTEGGAPTTDLDMVLDRALQSVAAGLAQSGAVVDRSPLPTVRADAIALERVLVNLVANAIVHARPGETPRIEVRARQQPRGWLISVRDHGPGVPDRIRERAFEPGVRGFSPDGPAGFGLGLATVRRLVEQQGGRAWIDPDTAEGTCVRMLLPMA